MAAKARSIYTIVNPLGQEVVLGFYQSDAIAANALHHSFSEGYRHKCQGPFRKRQLRPGEVMAAGVRWNEVEDHAFTQTDAPPWFAEALRTHSADAAEMLMMVKRRARYMAAEDERLSLFRRAMKEEEDGSPLGCGGPNLLIELLWSALGALHAAHLVSQVKPPLRSP